LIKEGVDLMLKTAIKLMEKKEEVEAHAEGQGPYVHTDDEDAGSKDRLVMGCDMLKLQDVLMLRILFDELFIECYVFFLI
jgi:hypothetical protein